MQPIAWLDSPTFDAHTGGHEHPERPERLQAIREGLAHAGLDTRLHRVQAPAATRAALERVHTPRYVATLEAFCAQGGGALDADTAVVLPSWDAAVRAAGAVTHAVHQVLSGAWQRAFCSVRPPGHHAPADRAMGFCLFDNVAVGAQAALDSGLARRVAILDWDVHHGNGTQDIFYDRGDVLFASWHQYPFYPGTGALEEAGEGAGRNTTVNCPLAAGSGDAEYLHAWETRIRPALEDFAPDLLCISAGFDADRRDPLGELTVTAGGFARLSQAVIGWADRQVGGRVVSVLEGGYSLPALAEDVVLHVESMF